MRRLAERFLPWGTAAAFGFVLVTLVAPALGHGVWDPYEVRSLELARRIALGLFGASDFALPDADNRLPTRGEVDRGELPFTSMALGLRLFGLHPFAARLALLAWALLALGATYALVRRLADRGSATLSVLLLAATPLFFVHSRTLLGDGVTHSALAVALSGLTLALYDRGSPRLRVGFFLFGCLGLVAGGLSRGVLLGVAVPALGPACAWLVQQLAGNGRRDGLATGFATALLVAGGAACAGGALVLSEALSDPRRYFALLGFGVVRGTTRPTFDALIHALGHGLFPLSALLPVAIGRLLLAPPAVEGARDEEYGLRFSVLFTATLGVGMGGLLADSAGVVPFGPVAALAVIAGLALGSLDRGAHASPAAGLVVCALLVLFLVDFRHGPEQLLRVFGVDSARFPESFQAAGERWLVAGTAVAVLGVLLAFLERDDPGAPIFSRDQYLAWPRTLRDLWNGNLLFGACVVEAALLGFLAFDLLGERVPSFRRFAAASELTRMLNRVAWLALPALFVAPFAVLAVRDALRWLARLRAREGWFSLLPRRGSLAAYGLVACGSGLGVGYYPGLAAQLSPREAFEAFRQRAQRGDALGVVGSSAAAGFYAAGRGATVFETAEQGYEWLLSAPNERRFLVFPSDALAGLNARHREATEPRRNLPVLSARSSEILLASNRLAPGERNENPLERYLLAALPKLTRPLDANLGNQLDVPGWDVLDDDGRSVGSVRPGRRYEFIIYFRVVARVTGTWETFVHIDGLQRRFNADHTTLDGAYPFSLWKVGDLVADRREFVLEPNFGAGAYRVYFGLYSGSRRMLVQRGAHSDDRVEAGTLLIE